MTALYFAFAAMVLAATITTGISLAIRNRRQRVIIDGLRVAYQRREKEVEDLNEANSELYLDVQRVACLNAELKAEVDTLRTACRMIGDGMSIERAATELAKPELAA